MNTAHSYFFGLTWGICILMSFIGWGTLLKKALLPDKTIDWAQRAAWGVALTIAVGGLLDLAQAISPLIIRIWVCLGFGILCYHLFDPEKIKSDRQKVFEFYTRKKCAFFGALLLIILTAFYYSSWGVTHLNYIDDLQAYAVFPLKMLQQGSLGIDPFSDRRTTALGGHSFLQALVLSKLQINNLRILDPGLGAIIAIGLLANGGLVAALFLLLTPPPSGNISSLVMGTALFLALFRFLEIQEIFVGKEIMARYIIIALLACAICSLKSNLIIFCGIFLVFYYLLRLKLLPSKKNTLLEGLTVALLTFVLLLPWMISSLHSNGTLLYPLLGRGYHQPNPLGFPSLKAFLNISSIVVLGLYLINIKRSSQNKIILMSAMVISIFLGLFVLNCFSTRIYPRYSFAFLYASLPLLMLYALSAPGKITYPIVLLSIIFFLHGYFIESPAMLWQQAKSSNAFIGLQEAPDDLFSKADTNSYYNAQHAIPPGQKVIARCFRPYLLDFKRNPVFIVDLLIPGPQGGMPVFSGAEAVAQYLLAQKIRYVLYSQDDFRKYQNKDLSRRMRSPQEPYFVKRQFLWTLKFEEDLDQLGWTRKRIYADHDIMAIDLTDHSSLEAKAAVAPGL